MGEKMITFRSAQLYNSFSVMLKKIINRDIIPYTESKLNLIRYAPAIGLFHLFSRIQIYRYDTDSKPIFIIFNPNSITLHSLQFDSLISRHLKFWDMSSNSKRTVYYCAYEVW